MFAIEVYLNSNRYKVNLSAGWYRGEDWKLLSLSLFNFFNGDTIDFINLSVLKFSISLTAYKVDA